MRKVLFFLSFAVASAALASVDVAACGDKYLRLAGRLGAGYNAEHRARVLIYMPPDSVVPDAARKLALHASLRQAGHQVHAIERESDLERSLTAHTYDIVIADASAAATLTPKLLRTAGRPSLLPIFHKQSKNQLADARKQLGCLIASRERAYHAVAEIDHVMELRKTTPVVP